jgi:2-polyprenyl-3-methyl-5-hydroxy-6-metoxy-1,4-benzoquinol methylase
MDFGLRIKENDRGRRRHMLKEYLKVRGDEFDDIEYNLRFIKRYKRLMPYVFRSPIADIGCGGGGFVRACTACGFSSIGIDSEINLEQDEFILSSGHYNVVHINAVIEHLENPEHILRESRRIMKTSGVLIINTPNFRMDYKNFYNDPTHKHPYTPESLSMLVKMFGFDPLLCEPALIRRSTLWWKVPFKWKVASMLPKGTRSILLIARKI